MMQPSPQAKSVPNPLENIVLEDEKEAAYDTSDPDQVNKAKKRGARTKADRLKFITAAMKHPEGRAWFYDLLLYTHVITTPYVMGDPYATAFKCGEANIGLRVLADIQESAPNEYLIMIQEGNARRG